MCCLLSCVTTLIIAAVSFHFEMSPRWLLISIVLLSSLNLHNAAAQSQMCEEPFKAAITVTANVTVSASSFDPDLVFYRNILHFTEEEIDRAAMRFYKDMYGLDFTSVEPNDQEQRILGNATFEPRKNAFNLTYVFNSWLVSGRTRTKCFPAEGGGFWVCFSGQMVLHGEYGGEGKPISTSETLFYSYDYIHGVCEQQALTFHFESLASSRSVEVDGYFVNIFRVTNRMLEGRIWGVGRSTTVNETTGLFEVRQVLTFL